MNNKCLYCGGDLRIDHELEGDIIKCIQCSRTPLKEDTRPLIQERNQHPHHGVARHYNKIPSYLDIRSEHKAITTKRNMEIKKLYEAGVKPSELGKTYKLSTASIKTICYRTK